MEKQMRLINPKLVTLVLLPYLATFYCVAHPNHLCRHGDLVSLLEFKHIFSSTSITPSLGYGSSTCVMNGQNPYPKMISWNETADCCNWDGVTCDEITGHIIGIDLSCSQLDGGVIDSSSSLFRLFQLENLNLAYNDFMPWTFPDDFQVFPRLRSLNLSSSYVQVRIPSISSHYSKLESLDLSNNGDITFEGNDFQILMQNLTLLRMLSLESIDMSSLKSPLNFSSSLTYLDLSYTGLHGIIPHVLYLPKLKTLLLLGYDNPTGDFTVFNCSSTHSLQVLDLSSTDFSGNFPNSIVCLKSLISLSLEGCGLSGSFPESIGNLTQLTTLKLSNNNLEGQIPREPFSNLQKLSSLRLDYNYFAGEFPSSIANFSKLQELQLQHNELNGALPSNATGLQKLSLMYLSYNSFSAPVPSWLFGLASLEQLYLDRNQFTGISGEFRRSDSLRVINLSYNKLNGPFPGFISTLVGLTRLDLSRNHLSGNVEQSMFSNLTQLQILDLSFNRLSWRGEESANITLPNLTSLSLASCVDLTDFPYSLRNFKMLEKLDLSNTTLVLWGWEERVSIFFPNLWFLSLPYCDLKEFPHFLKNLDKLEFLDLSHNKIQGQIPLIPWMNIKYFDLGFNGLQGPLPASICHLEALSILDLSNNEFSGAMPQCFRNLGSQISVLNLKNNAIQGRITLAFSRGSSLNNLGLNGNLLEGPLPRSLVNCQQLEVLDVGNNKINDSFPAWLGNLKELQVLILKSNKFFGSIVSFKNDNSFGNLRILDLSSNQFNGSIPASLLKNLRAMMSSEGNSDSRPRYMVADSNASYYDSVNITAKGMDISVTRILTTLKMIDLSDNTFGGKIPKDIGNLIFLKFLNLSHNHLFGGIPSPLANLTSLEFLDLSCNQLEGEIPWQLTNLTSLAALNLSYNRLVGQIPHGKQFGTFSNDSYLGNMGLCGFPLTKSCVAPLPRPPLPMHQEEEEEDSGGFFSGFTWKSVAVGYGFGFVLGLAVGSLMFFIGKPERFVMFVEDEIYRFGPLLPRKHKVNKR